MNILRRLSLPRLLLLCGLVLAIGVSATALAFALGSGPTPPAEPLAQAVHNALSGPGRESVQGVSASVKLTDHLLEGANLTTDSEQGRGLSSSPLLSGASGRLWIAQDGHARLELQAEQGDTQVIWDGHTVSIYDAASNTLYRYTPPAQEDDEAGALDHATTAPSVAQVEQAISHIERHAKLSGAKPDDVAGQPAYTVRLSPEEGGSLLGGAELSFDADNGAPLRAAVYSSTSSAPVIELTATEVSFGPVDDAVFQFTPPAGAKIETITIPARSTHGQADPATGTPKLTTRGRGVSSVAVLEGRAHADAKGGEPLAGLPKVDIDGASASELRTELGTVLTFERSGVRYLLAGSVSPGAIEALARGL